MNFQVLTLKSIRARSVSLKLKRPVVARIATLTEWPLILIDLYRPGKPLQSRRISLTSAFRVGD